MKVMFNILLEIYNGFSREASVIDMMLSTTDTQDFAKILKLFHCGGDLLVTTR